MCKTVNYCKIVAIVIFYAVASRPRHFMTVYFLIILIIDLLSLFFFLPFLLNTYLLGSQYTGTNAQFCVQHLIRKLGSEPYIGQRAILSVCQRLLVLAERLLFCDPFDDDFPEMHECMFIM